MTKDDKDHESDKKPEFEAPVYTGQGFIPIDDLIESIKAWQQRKVLCEDVDFLENKGGTLP